MNAINTERYDILTKRSCKIIEKGGRILLKKNGSYLHAWTDISAGWDKAVFGRKYSAKEFCDLKIAFAVAPYFACKVVVLYPNKKEKKMISRKTKYRRSYYRSGSGPGSWSWSGSRSWSGSGSGSRSGSGK